MFIFIGIIIFILIINNLTRDTKLKEKHFCIENRDNITDTKIMIFPIYKVLKIIFSLTI